jgi:hypothetical protein
LFIGCLKGGSVVEVDKLDMKSALEKWEEMNQVNLKKLLKLVAKIKELGTAVEGKKCCLLYDGKKKPASVKLIKSNHGGFNLSDDLKKFWADKLVEK